MQTFTTLYESTKATKVKYIGPYTSGGESDSPAVILEMAGQRFLAMAMAGQGSSKHPDNETIERPNIIGVRIGNSTVFIEGVESEFVQAKLWSYRNGRSTNRSKHTYPVLDKDVKTMTESSTAWLRLKKIIVPAVQKLFTTNETAIRKWNANNVPANQIQMPGETETKTSTNQPAVKAVDKVSKKPAKSKGNFGDWLSGIAKSANVKYSVTGEEDFAKLRFASSDIISKNKLKSEIEHLGARTTKASNSSVAVYELDDKHITIGYDYMMVRKK